MTLRLWQQKQAPSLRTCRALSLVSLARGPLRPLCVVRMASKHSKGFGLPDWALIRLGVMMTNLPGASAFRFSTLPGPLIFRIGLAALPLLLCSSLMCGDRGLDERCELLDGDRCCGGGVWCCC